MDEEKKGKKGGDYAGLPEGEPDSVVDNEGWVDHRTSGLLILQIRQGWILTAWRLILRNPRDVRRGWVLRNGTGRSLASAEAEFERLAPGLRTDDLSDIEIYSMYVSYCIEQDARETVTSTAPAATAPPPPPAGPSCSSSSCQHASTVTETVTVDGDTVTPSAPPQEASAAASSSSATPQTAAPTAEPEEATDGNTCPICFDDIEPSDAAMRCANAHPHYFHQSCMRDWIRQCRANHTAPSCPICRSDVQIHQARLREYLNGEAGTATMESEDERTFWQSLLDSLPGEGWQSAFSRENLQYAGTIAVAAGWGFHSGWTQRGMSPMDQMMWNSMPRHAQVAGVVGWGVGLVSKMVKNSREEERNRRGGSRRR